MASRVSTSPTAGEVAWEYLASRYPDIAASDLAVLELGGGWLVETVLDLNAEGGGKLLLMINRHGFVEELGGGPGTRQVARRNLSAIGTPQEQVIQL